MNILLVRPPRIKQAITVGDFMFSEPLGLEMIYGVIKENYYVEIFDMMIETISLSEKIKKSKVDIIGITSLCIDVNMVKSLCREIKDVSKGIITFVGGTQTYLNPEAFIDGNVDYIFEYTNKQNLNLFCDLVKKGLEVEDLDGILSKKQNYKSTNVKMKNEYLLPDRESTKKYRNKYSYFGYRPAAIMEFGMGCNKLCEFCLRWRIEGSKEKLIDLELTKKDLRNIKERTIMFIDNDFFANKEKVETFIQIAKELKLEKNYIVYGSVRGIIEYKDIIKEFVDIGLKAILVGYESFDDKEMRSYNKKSDASDNYEAAKILKSFNVDVWASFIAHPNWNKKDFKSMRKYIKKLQPEISSINPLTPFPNLPMYKEYYNRLLYRKEDYEKWSFGQVIILPSNMSLGSYYYELLKTNLYVNLFINRKTDMIKHYGISNIFRIVYGSLKTMRKYIKLMVES